MLKATCPVNLPVLQKWDQLVDAVRTSQVVIVTGETGCGKTTQLAKICLEAGQGGKRRIVCTQPRRVAAISIARRVQEELSPLGIPDLVGYKVRFRDKTSFGTRIKFVTDGILLAELQGDPLLREYDTIIVDEAHERSLNIDILLGSVRLLLKKRPELRLVITSATMNVEVFQKAFPDAPFIQIQGRSYPVQVFYYSDMLAQQGLSAASLEEQTPVDMALRAIRMIREQDRMGHILVFMPTELDIRRLIKAIRDEMPADTMPLPMFGRLTSAEQDRIFQDTTLQKIVCATNIAETSITVPGIRYVVDSGLARISRYNVRSRLKILPVSPISRSSAEQRAGRAGRVSSGICIRLYSREEFEARQPFDTPEILRSNLSETILKLLAMGIRDIHHFPFLEAPSLRAFSEGIETLKEVMALNRHKELTPMGRIMARLPLDPRISRMILEAKALNALKEVVILAAALSIQDPRERPSQKEGQADQLHSVFKNPSSDFVTLLNIWNFVDEFRKERQSRTAIKRLCATNFLSFTRMEEWRDVYDQILAILSDMGGFSLNQTPASYDAIHKAVIAGFPCHVAMQKEGVHYTGARGRQLVLFPGSAVYRKRPKWIVSAEQVKTSQLFARVAAEIKPEWVEEVAADLVTRSYSEPRWDRDRGDVMAWEKVSLFGLTLVERRRVSYSGIAPEQAEDIFVREALVSGALKGGYAFLKHNMQVLEELVSLEDKTRRADLVVDEGFMAEELKLGLQILKKDAQMTTISRESQLKKAIRLAETGDRPLFLSKERLLKNAVEESELSLFPGHLEVNGHILQLVYSFSPGSENDGVTVQIQLEHLFELDARVFQWLVPGFLQNKIEAILQKLPKNIRKDLFPMQDTAREIFQQVRKDAGQIPLFEALEQAVYRLKGVRISRETWPSENELPHHLQMRFEIFGRAREGRREILASGRDLGLLQRQLGLTIQERLCHAPEFLRLSEQWNGRAVSLMNVCGLPEVFRVVGAAAESDVFLGFEFENGLKTRLFWDRNEASQRTVAALARALEEVFDKEIRWLKAQFSSGGMTPQESVFLGLGRMADNAVRHVLTAVIEERLGEIRRVEMGNLLPGLREGFVSQGLREMKALNAVLKEFRVVWQELKRMEAGSKGKPVAQKVMECLKQELNELIPTHFPLNCDEQWLAEIPRHLNALTVRARRASENPMKDLAKLEGIRPVLEGYEAICEMAVSKAMNGSAAKEWEELRAMLWEYKLSVFAPELGVRRGISTKRILEAMEALKYRLRNG
ncbi:MAG: ATP-dependent RNA helicase HrpA [Deltaproteobacteria bacterium]|nr:ATP-dependent RNA helicase HrpA [Deltaproteobacteria bacterium]